MPSHADVATALGSPTSGSFQKEQSPVQRRTSAPRRGSFSGPASHRNVGGKPPASESAPHLPLPATTPGDIGMKAEKPEDIEVLKLPQAPNGKASTTHVHTSKMSTAEADGFLLPARNPPRYSYFDLFPFSLLVKTLTKRGKTVKGKKGALLRAKLHRQSVTHNLPLEISLYLVGLISVRFFFSFPQPYSRARTLPRFKTAKLSMPPQFVRATFDHEGNTLTDPPRRLANMIATLAQLVDALTGLERILTTPIPYSCVLLCLPNRWILTIA
jgi:putative membrane protein